MTWHDMMLRKITQIVTFVFWAPVLASPSRVIYTQFIILTLALSIKELRGVRQNSS